MYMKKLVQLRDHYLVVWHRLHIVAKYFSKYDIKGHHARKYLQLPLQQWGAGNVYLLVLSSWKVNIAKIHIAVMGL